MRVAAQSLLWAFPGGKGCESGAQAGLTADAAGVAKAVRKVSKHYAA